MNDRDAQIVRMLRRGNGVDSLAEMFGMTASDIERIGSCDPDARAKIVLELLGRGLSRRAIAKQVGITPVRVGQIARENGVALNYNNKPTHVTPEEIARQLDAIWAERFAGKRFEPMTEWEARP